MQARQLRWLSYGLCTVFILLMLIALGIQVNWIRERRQATFQSKGGRYHYVWALDGRTGRHAPLSIRLLGERPIYAVGIVVQDPDQLRPHERDELARLRKLFPEANVKLYFDADVAVDDPTCRGRPRSRVEQSSVVASETYTAP